MTTSEMFQPKREIQGYKKVRSAARNYRSYSSDLLGDADIRDYRHLPLEADPPRHTQLRAALMPVFAAESITPRMPEFEALARSLVSDIAHRGRADLVSEFALPYVMGCLGIIYNRRQDVAEWVSWGPDVWTAEVHLAGGEVTAETKRAQRERNFTIKTQRSAHTLDTYLTRVFEEAAATASEGRTPTDVWEFLVDSAPGGEKMTHEELLGTGSVLLAGGRDTVIKLISGFLWHLIKNPVDREYLRDHPDGREAAVAEMARYLSPLPKMERVEVDPEGAVSEGERVLLSFVSANFDAAEFEAPETLNLRRDTKPSLAFGFGRHSCLGLQITTHEALAFLEALLPVWPAWDFDGEPGVEWQHESVDGHSISIIDSFSSIPVLVGATQRERAVETDSASA